MAKNSVKSWENVIALSDEMASLIQTGVSLEAGLSGIGFGSPGRLRMLGTTLAHDLKQGESLDEAIAARSDQYPDIFRAVIEIGLKSQRLPSALEAISNFARHLLDIRRNLILSLLYPCIALAVLYPLFLFVLWYPLPRLLYTLELSGGPLQGFPAMLNYLSQNVGLWVYGAPGLVFGVLGLHWLFSSRSHAAVVAPSFFRWFPGFGQTTRDYEHVLFTEMLALCLEQKIPLPTALLYAADASGNKQIPEQAELLSLQLNQGDTLRNALQSPGISAFPPLLKWLMAVGEQQGLLENTMLEAAGMYSRRAKRRAELLQTIVPILFILLVVGGLIFLYCLTLFLPFTELLYRLTAP